MKSILKGVSFESLAIVKEKMEDVLKQLTESDLLPMPFTSGKADGIEVSVSEDYTEMDKH